MYEIKKKKKPFVIPQSRTCLFGIFKSGKGWTDILRLFSVIWRVTGRPSSAQDAAESLKPFVIVLIEA